jgi:two-component system chemotaxis response regulator CheB
MRTLVIDDSVVSRAALARMLEASPLVEVVGTARDGEEALRKALELAPDLITLDLEMPRMDGFTFLRVLMERRPTPVLVVSGRAGAEDVFRALELGAADFIAKPAPRASRELAGIEAELIRKVHALRELRVDRLGPRGAAAPPRRPGPAAGAPPQRPTPAAGAPPSLVVLGASTGGPAALVRVLGAFTQAPASAFCVAQHMPAGFTRGFAERLARVTPLRASEARGGEELAPGTLLVAPGGRHLELESAGGSIRARVVAGGPRDRFVPSVDRLFESAAKQLGPAVLAVVLTGMGDDGRLGARAVREAGGSVVAEDESTAVVFGMPRQAILGGAVDAVLPLHDIANAIRHGVRRASAPADATRRRG